MTKRLDQNSNGSRFTNSRRALVAMALSAAALGGSAGNALAASPSEAPPIEATAVFHRAVSTVATDRLDDERRNYDRLFERAKKLDVEPKRNTADEIFRGSVLDAKLETLQKDVRRKARKLAEPEYGTPESVGVSQSTLDAIAACESGGSPTVIDASGTYYGKYQFDLGTWASVGGSGSPAEAPEAEQDYRAALLMSQAGSSPWPVCG